jgi:hypothetical protein
MGVFANRDRPLSQQADGRQFVTWEAAIGHVVDSLEQQLLVRLLIVYNPRGTDIRFHYFPTEGILI